jgi:hypothetical protein
MKNILLLSFMTIITSCKYQQTTHNEQLIVDAKWMMYCFNHHLSGIEIDSFSGPYYVPITCELKFHEADTINQNTVEINYHFFDNGKRIVMVDTINKTITRGGKEILYYPSRYNTVMRIYPIYATNLRPVDIDSSYASYIVQFKDSMEQRFLEYGKLHIDKMDSWLREEFIRRLNEL